MAEYLMWIEIFAGAASMIAETRLRRATKKLVEKFNEEGLPDELITDPRGVAAQNTLQQISGVALDFAQYAAKEYEKIIVGLRSRIKTSTGAFDIEHFELEFNAQKIKNIIAEIIILERNAGVKIYSRKFVEEFVIMSCRSDLKKKFTYVESLTMLNYYVKVTLVKGFCTGFHNLNDYKLFCNKFKNYTDDFFDALDLDIQKYEVQGSVLFKHHPNNPTIPAGPPPGIVPLTRGNPPVILTPEDFDGRMLISAEDGKKVANYLKKYWTEIKPTLDRRNFSKKRWAFIQKINGVYIDKQFTKGMLNKSILPLEYVDGLKTAVKNNGSDIFFPLNEQGFSEVGGAFIIKGSSYDILPVMEFKY